MCKGVLRRLLTLKYLRRWWKFKVGELKPRLFTFFLFWYFIKEKRVTYALRQDFRMSLQLSGYLSSSVDRNRKRNSRRSLTRATWQYVLPNCSEAKRYNTYGFSYWLFSSWTVSDARLPTLSLNTSKVGQIVAQAVSALWLRCIVEALFLEENYTDFIVCKFTPDNCSVAVASSVVGMS